MRNKPRVSINNNNDDGTEKLAERIKYSGYKLPSAFCDDAFCQNNIITPTVKVYIRLHPTITINPSNVCHLLDTFYIAADSNAFGKYSDNRDGFAFMFRADLRKE